MIQLLVQHGADLDSKTDNAETPLSKYQCITHAFPPHPHPLPRQTVLKPQSVCMCRVHIAHVFPPPFPDFKKDSAEYSGSIYMKGQYSSCIPIATSLMLRKTVLKPHSVVSVRRVNIACTFLPSPIPRQYYKC